MKEKLRKLLAEACKDMGLTEKGIDTLCEIGAQGLTETSSDDDIKKAADSLVPFAKAMQGEITRKFAIKPKPEPEPKPKPKPEPEPKPGNDDLAKLIAEQLAPLKTQLDKLQGENDALKAEKAKSERSATIASKAKELGIPDYLVKRFSISDDADIEKELNEFKQDLVNNNLMSKDAALVKTTKEEEMKKEAQRWAESLPGNNQ